MPHNARGVLMGVLYVLLIFLFLQRGRIGRCVSCCGSVVLAGVALLLLCGCFYCWCCGCRWSRLSYYCLLLTSCCCPAFPLIPPCLTCLVVSPLVFSSRLVLSPSHSLARGSSDVPRFVVLSCDVVVWCRAQTLRRML